MLIPPSLWGNVILKQPVEKWKIHFYATSLTAFWNYYFWSKTDCFLIDWANILKEHLNELYRRSMGMAEHCTKVYFHLILCVFVIQK